MGELSIMPTKEKETLLVRIFSYVYRVICNVPRERAEVESGVQTRDNTPFERSYRSTIEPTSTVLNQCVGVGRKLRGSAFPSGRKESLNDYPRDHHFMHHHAVWILPLSFFPNFVGIEGSTLGNVLNFALVIVVIVEFELRIIRVLGHGEPPRHSRIQSRSRRRF